MARLLSVAQTWEALRNVAFEVAQDNGFHYRDTAPVFYGDPAMLSVTSARMAFHLILLPDGEARFKVKHPTKTMEAVANILDFDAEEFRRLLADGFAASARKAEKELA